MSRIGFGGATAGLKNYTGAFDPQKQADREGVVAAIRRAYELGINYFDTAAGYGDGASEEIFGEGLAGIPEEEIFLATKAFPTDPKKVRASWSAASGTCVGSASTSSSCTAPTWARRSGGRSSARAASCRSSKSSGTRAW